MMVVAVLATIMTVDLSTDEENDNVIVMMMTMTALCVLLALFSQRPTRCPLYKTQPTRAK